MVISLVVASIGMARFAVAMGYSANAGYAVGGAFDIAKDIVLVFVLALRARGALGIAIAITTGWICLVTVSGWQRTQR